MVRTKKQRKIMNIQKNWIKTIFYLITVGIFFCACDKESKPTYNPEKETVKKLPSKMTTTSTFGESVLTFQYDDLNRLVKIETFTSFYIPPHTVTSFNSLEISYHDNHTPAIIKGESSMTSPPNDKEESWEDTVFYKNDEIIAGSRWIRINSKGEILQDNQMSYTYNSNGNISRINSRHTATGNTPILTFNLAYTSVPSVFRHVNTPDWFIFSWLNGGFAASDYGGYSKNGYMVEKILDRSWGNSDGKDQSLDMHFTYEVDTDGYGYVTKRNSKSGDGKVRPSTTYEYILAK
jgi:hypothetical protein